MTFYTRALLKDIKIEQYFSFITTLNHCIACKANIFCYLFTNPDKYLLFRCYICKDTYRVFYSGYQVYIWEPFTI